MKESYLLTSQIAQNLYTHAEKAGRLSHQILISLLKGPKSQSELAVEKQQRADSNRCIYFANVYTIEYKPCWVIMRQEQWLVTPGP